MQLLRFECLTKQSVNGPIPSFSFTTIDRLLRLHRKVNTHFDKAIPTQLYIYHHDIRL